ncbi:MAG: hypothetical protein EBT93_13240, partial [Alphaproteobacteria bacterium]|nr:hypothetical protein [Alphaproteobacteria bacterium]
MTAMVSPSARVSQRSSGLTIASTEMPYANSIAIGIWISAGSRDETDQEHLDTLSLITRYLMAPWPP